MDMYLDSLQESLMKHACIMLSIYINRNMLIMKNKWNKNSNMMWTFMKNHPSTLYYRISVEIQIISLEQILKERRPQRKVRFSPWEVSSM